MTFCSGAVVEAEFQSIYCLFRDVKLAHGVSRRKTRQASIAHHEGFLHLDYNQCNEAKRDAMKFRSKSWVGSKQGKTRSKVLLDQGATNLQKQIYQLRYPRSSNNIIYLMSSEQVVEASQSPNVAEKKQRVRHQKGEKVEHKKIRHERPAEYNMNEADITVDTVLEPLPAKKDRLPKPNLDQVKQREAKNKQRIAKLRQKRKQIYDQKFKPNRPVIKGEGGKHDTFNSEIEQFKELKDRFNEVKNQRNSKRDALTKLIEEAKQNNATLKSLREASKNTKENLSEKIEELTHRLTISDLSKDQERNLNSQIQTLKRKMLDSQPAGNIEARIQKAEKRKEELDEQIDRLKGEKQPLEQEFKDLRDEMDAKNEAISKIKGEIKNQKDVKDEFKLRNDKEHDDWKQNKKKRIDEIKAKIEAIQKENDLIWDQYRKKQDQFWEQKYKIDFLEWQHRVKERKIRDIERQKRRQQAEQRDKQREKEEQLQKYIKEIELCNFLEKYLRDIIQPEKKEEQKQQKTENVNVESLISEDPQWKKEKGVVILQSKKSKEDEEPARKAGKKNKKKGEKPEEESKAKKFEIPFNIQILFDTIKVLPPTSLDEVENKIKEINEREKLFERACKEEVSEEDKQAVEKVKAGEKKERKQKTQQIKEDEFPTL